MALQKVSVSVDEKHVGRLAEVVRRAKRAGLRVDQQLDTIGVVTGSIDSNRVADLRQVEGVTAVEQDRSYQLPDPNSPVQ